MFIYLAAAYDVNQKDNVKIGLCYGELHHKRHNLHYKSGFDIIEAIEIPSTLCEPKCREIEAGTQRRMLERNPHSLHHRPYDRFEASAISIAWMVQHFASIVAESLDN